MSKLITHAGTRRIDEGIVRSVPEPEFTKTWHPVSHSRVIDALQGAVIEAGLGIREREYSLNHSGTRMFGSWTLDHMVNGSAYCLVFRNSIDKSMLLGVGGGLKAFICDNLAIWAEFLAFSKHTSGLDDDRLVEMSQDALTGAWGHMEKLDHWHRSLKTVDVPAQQFKEIAYDLMDNNVFAPSRLKAFQEAHEEERSLIKVSYDFTGRNLATHYDRPTSLHTIHGACTRLMRTENLFQVADRNRGLIRVCDDYLERRAA
ncbi:MAG: hypothetical protein DRH97_02955 [Chloroflexi bacterium]|nr:MAG: hypothetical protein DRH97_02955 [Chloroflexota bacterium]